MYFYLKEPNAGKITPINLHYYINKKEKYFKYPIGRSIHPNEWNFDNRLPKTSRGAAGVKSKQLLSKLSQYSNLLDDIIDECEKLNKPITKVFLKVQFDKEFKHKSKASIDNFKNVAEVIDLFIASKNKSKGQSKSWNEKYTNLRNKVLLFDLYNKRETLFDEIGEDWIDRYCGFLRELPKLLENNKLFGKKALELSNELKFKLPKNPYNDNTLNRHINFLFTFLIWSKRKYHNIDTDALKNPVKDYQADDVHLTTEEVKLLETVRLPRESLRKVRDLFLIGVYSGQRFSDYSLFEKSDVLGDMIIKKAEKTESESFIPLHNKLKVLLDKYKWDLPKISSQKFNPHIQEICRIAKIIDEVKTTEYIGNEKIIKYHQKCDTVSSHTARRTFITLSSERGMPDHIIMKITGIKDPKTLLKYKKTSQQAIIESINKYW